MINVNLELYRYFYYVALEGSVSGAARRLCVSQPAVSQAMKSLESSLQGKLLIRTSKGIKLTHEGDALFSYVKSSLDTLSAGEEFFKKMMNLDSGEITIGASDMTLQFYLLPYLEDFHEQFPHIKINVTNAPTPETLKNLTDGKIDFGIVSTPFDIPENFSSTNVSQLKTTFVAGSDYKHLKGKILKLDSLASLPIISLESNTSTRRYTDQFLAEKNVYMSPEFELATSDMIVQFALRNLGIGCVVYDFAKNYIDSGELFELKFKEKMPKRYISIVTNGKTVISTAAKQLLEMMNIS